MSRAPLHRMRRWAAWGAALWSYQAIVVGGIGLLVTAAARRWEEALYLLELIATVATAGAIGGLIFGALSPLESRPRGLYLRCYAASETAWLATCAGAGLFGLPLFDENVRVLIHLFSSPLYVGSLLVILLVLGLLPGHFLAREIEKDRPGVIWTGLEDKGAA